MGWEEWFVMKFWRRRMRRRWIRRRRWEPHTEKNEEERRTKGVALNDTRERREHEIRWTKDTEMEGKKDSQIYEVNAFVPWIQIVHIEARIQEPRDIQRDKKLWLESKTRRGIGFFSKRKTLNASMFESSSFTESKTSRIHVRLRLCLFISKPFGAMLEQTKEGKMAFCKDNLSEEEDDGDVDRTVSAHALVYGSVHRYAVVPYASTKTLYRR